MKGMVDAPQPERATSSNECSTSSEEGRWRSSPRLANQQYSSQIWDDLISRVLQRNRVAMGLAAGVHPAVAANDSLAGRDPISVVTTPQLRSLGTSHQPLDPIHIPLRKNIPPTTDAADELSEDGTLGTAEKVEDEVEAIELVNRNVGGRQLYLSTISQLMAGGIAGAVSKSCTAPLARLTILFQVRRQLGCNRAKLTVCVGWKQQTCAMYYLIKTISRS